MADAGQMLGCSDQNQVVSQCSDGKICSIKDLMVTTGGYAPAGFRALQVVTSLTESEQRPTRFTALRPCRPVREGVSGPARDKKKRSILASASPPQYRQKIAKTLEEATPKS